MDIFTENLLLKGENFKLSSEKNFVCVTLSKEEFSEDDWNMIIERCANQDRGVRNSAIVREFSEEQYPEAYNEFNKQYESTWEKRKNNIIQSVNLRKESEKDK